MGWIIFRGKDDPPGTRWSMVESSEVRMVPQPQVDDIPTVAVFQGTQSGVIAKLADVEYFEEFAAAWQGCQDKVAGEASGG